MFDGKTPRTAGTFQLQDITDPLIRGFIDDPNHRSDICNVSAACIQVSVYPDKCYRYMTGGWITLLLSESRAL